MSPRLDAMWEHRATARVAAAVGLTVVVVAIFTGTRFGLAGLPVLTAALIRIADQAAADRARRTYPYLRGRCGGERDEE